jgi:hypothetical protein
MKKPLIVVYTLLAMWACGHKIPVVRRVRPTRSRGLRKTVLSRRYPFPELRVSVERSMLATRRTLGLRRTTRLANRGTTRLANRGTNRMAWQTGGILVPARKQRVAQPRTLSIHKPRRSHATHE